MSREFKFPLNRKEVELLEASVNHYLGTLSSEDEDWEILIDLRDWLLFKLEEIKATHEENPVPQSDLNDTPF